MSERLQKVLARAGHGSRRSSEQIISSGRVTVNGATVTRLGTQVDVAVDIIAVDGIEIGQSVELAYLALHKPSGYVTTASDPQRRRTVMDLLPAGLPPHVLPVGRLDRDTEGLLIFTNDGELAHRLAHPRYQIEKQYLAQVQGKPSRQAIDSLRSGVVLGDRRTVPADADITEPPDGHTDRDGYTWLRLVIHEGRKRQVRLMCAAVGHPVRILVRTRIDGIALGSLQKGDTRSLTSEEVLNLRKDVNLETG